MFERLVENWLTKVNEKSFQVPFCHLLTAEGYKVVHLSRHGPFEEGKDILAIDPDGVPCAFQLKGSNGKISEREWSKYIDQVIRLVEIPIKHPSIDTSLPRRVYFVTNGELDEEVRLQILHRNEEWKRRNLPELLTMVKGDLLTNFLKLQKNLWPITLFSEKEFLELYLSNGNGYLDKPKFAGFLEKILLEETSIKNSEIDRNLASLALITSIALSPFSQKHNHVALIEGWVIYFACLTSLVEKHNAGKKTWIEIATLAKFVIETALTDLFEELKERKYLVEGDPLVDAPFYRGRLTCLIGLLCVFVLWQKQLDPTWKIDNWFEDFLHNNFKQLELWGEAAVPQLLAIFWCLSKIDLDNLGNRLIFEMVEGIIHVNITDQGISDPYHHLGEVVMMKLGFMDSIQKENFMGRTYTLDSLIQLLARRGWRGVIADLWKPITGLQLVEFEPEYSWQFCLWNCEEGNLHETLPKTPQSWKELETKSKEIVLSKIPNILKDDPILLLLFIFTYPHRLTPDVVKHLDEMLISGGRK